MSEWPVVVARPLTKDEGQAVSAGLRVLMGISTHGDIATGLLAALDAGRICIEQEDEPTAPAAEPSVSVVEHLTRQVPPWPPFDEANYMLSRFECATCEWKGGTFNDSKFARRERERAQQAAFEHEADSRTEVVVDEPTNAEAAFHDRHVINDDAWEAAKEAPL